MHLFAPFCELISWSTHVRGKTERKTMPLSNQLSSARLNTFLPPTQFKIFTSSGADFTCKGERD